MKKYRTSRYSDRISEIEVVRMTEASVVLVNRYGNRSEERTERKVTSDHHWFDTWVDAKKHLMENAIREMESAEREVARAKKRISTISELKESGK